MSYADHSSTMHRRSPSPMNSDSFPLSENFRSPARQPLSASEFNNQNFDQFGPPGSSSHSQRESRRNSSLSRSYSSSLHSSPFPPNTLKIAIPGIVVLIIASIHVGHLVSLHEAAWEDDCMLAGLRGGGSYGRGMHTGYLSTGWSGTGTKESSPAAETEGSGLKSGGSSSLSSGRFSELKNRSAALAREKGLAGARKTGNLSFSRSRDHDDHGNEEILGDTKATSNGNGNEGGNNSEGGPGKAQKAGTGRSDGGRKPRKAFIDLSGNSLDLFLAAYPDARDYELYTLDCESGGGSTSGGISNSKDTGPSYVSANVYDPSAKMGSKAHDSGPYGAGGRSGFQSPKYFHLRDELSGFGVDRFHPLLCWRKFRIHYEVKSPPRFHTLPCWYKYGVVNKENANPNTAAANPNPHTNSNPATLPATVLTVARNSATSIAGLPQLPFAQFVNENFSKRSNDEVILRIGEGDAEILGFTGRGRISHLLPRDEFEEAHVGDAAAYGSGSGGPHGSNLNAGGQGGSGASLSVVDSVLQKGKDGFAKVQSAASAISDVAASMVGKILGNDDARKTDGKAKEENTNKPTSTKRALQQANTNQPLKPVDLPADINSNSDRSSSQARTDKADSKKAESIHSQHLLLNGVNPLSTYIPWKTVVKKVYAPENFWATANRNPNQGPNQTTKNPNSNSDWIQLNLFKRAEGMAPLLWPSHELSFSDMWSLNGLIRDNTGNMVSSVDLQNAGLGSLGGVGGMNANGVRGNIAGVMGPGGVVQTASNNSNRPIFKKCSAGVVDAGLGGMATGNFNGGAGGLAYPGWNAYADGASGYHSGGYPGNYPMADGTFRGVMQQGMPGRGNAGAQYGQGYGQGYGQYNQGAQYGQFGQIFNQQRRGYNQGNYNQANYNQANYNQPNYNQPRNYNRRKLQMRRQGAGSFAGNYNNYVVGNRNQRNNYGNNMNPFLQNRNYPRGQGGPNYQGMNSMPMQRYGPNMMPMGPNSMPMSMANSNFPNSMQAGRAGNNNNLYANGNVGDGLNGNTNSNSSPLAAIGVLIGMDAGVARAFFMRVWAQAKVLGLKPAEVKITAFVYAKFVETFPDLVAGWVRNGVELQSRGLRQDRFFTQKAKKDVESNMLRGQIIFSRFTRDWDRAAEETGRRKVAEDEERRIAEEKAKIVAEEEVRRKKEKKEEEARKKKEAAEREKELEEKADLKDNKEEEAKHQKTKNEINENAGGKTAVVKPRETSVKALDTIQQDTKAAPAPKRHLQQFTSQAANRNNPAPTSNIYKMAEPTSDNSNNTPTTPINYKAQQTLYQPSSISMPSFFIYEGATLFVKMKQAAARVGWQVVAPTLILPPIITGSGTSGGSGASAGGSSSASTGNAGTGGVHPRGRSVSATYNYSVSRPRSRGPRMLSAADSLASMQNPTSNQINSNDPALQNANADPNANANGNSNFNAAGVQNNMDAPGSESNANGANANGANANYANVNAADGSPNTLLPAADPASVAADPASVAADPASVADAATLLGEAEVGAEVFENDNPVAENAGEVGNPEGVGELGEEENHNVIPVAGNNNNNGLHDLPHDFSMPLPPDQIENNVNVGDPGLINLAGGGDRVDVDPFDSQNVDPNFDSQASAVGSGRSQDKLAGTDVQVQLEAAQELSQLVGGEAANNADVPVYERPGPQQGAAQQPEPPGSPDDVAKINKQYFGQFAYDPENPGNVAPTDKKKPVAANPAVPAQSSKGSSKPSSNSLLNLSLSSDPNARYPGETPRDPFDVPGSSANPSDPFSLGQSGGVVDVFDGRNFDGRVFDGRLVDERSGSNNGFWMGGDADADREQAISAPSFKFQESSGSESTAMYGAEGQFAETKTLPTDGTAQTSATANTHSLPTKDRKGLTTPTLSNVSGMGLMGNIIGGLTGGDNHGLSNFLMSNPIKDGEPKKGNANGDSKGNRSRFERFELSYSTESINELFLKMQDNLVSTADYFRETVGSAAAIAAEYLRSFVVQGMVSVGWMQDPNNVDSSGGSGSSTNPGGDWSSLTPAERAYLAGYGEDGETSIGSNTSLNYNTGISDEENPYFRYLNPRKYLNEALSKVKSSGVVILDADFGPNALLAMNLVKEAAKGSFQMVAFSECRSE